MLVILGLGSLRKVFIARKDCFSSTMRDQVNLYFLVIVGSNRLPKAFVQQVLPNVFEVKRDMRMGRKLNLNK